MEIRLSWVTTAFSLLDNDIYNDISLFVYDITGTIDGLSPR